METPSPNLHFLAGKSLILMPTRLQIERWGPLLMGLLGAAAWWMFDGEISSFYAKELLAALLSAAAIAAGFLTTALSILLPLAATEVGRKLRRSNYLPHLYNYLRRALYSCLALAIICVCAFFYLKEGAAPPHLLATVLIFSSAYSAAALVRIAEVLINLFELASEPEDKDG